MDILEDLRTTTFSNNEAFFKKAACEIEQLRTENAALKEQVAHWKNNHETEVRRARVLKERTDMPLERVHAYDKWGNDQETIAQQAERIVELNKECNSHYETCQQQAEAIRLKDVVLEKIACIGNGDTHGNSIGNCLAIDALAIQPSPEILQARDEKVAEACAKLVNRFIGGDGILNDTWVHEIEDAIRSGEWREYL